MVHPTDVVKNGKKRKPPPQRDKVVKGGGRREAQNANNRIRQCGWAEWGRLGLDERKIVEECKRKTQIGEDDSENPIVKEDIDSIIGTQYVTNNVLAKFIEKLKYNDRVQLYDNNLYIAARRARNAWKGGDDRAVEWMDEAAAMITRHKNWQNKKHYFVISKIGQVNHMRLGQIDFRSKSFYTLDPMQGEHEYMKYRETDPEGFQEECEIMEMLGHETSKAETVIPYGDWYLGRAKGPEQTDACHCMVFVLMYMYYVHETGSLPPMNAFKSEDMEKIRIFIAWVVVLGADIPRLETAQYVGLAIAHRDNVRRNAPKEQLERRYRTGEEGKEVQEGQTETNEKTDKGNTEEGRENWTNRESNREGRKQPRKKEGGKG